VQDPQDPQARLALKARLARKARQDLLVQLVRLGLLAHKVKPARH
jgi:hypothetical protein